MFFVVTMTHPDGPGWGEHVMPHVDYLNGLIAGGKLRASGPVIGGEMRAGLLLFTVTDRAELDALIAADPFALQGLISELTVTEWNPLFGAFADEAAAYVGPAAK